MLAVDERAGWRCEGGVTSWDGVAYLSHLTLFSDLLLAYFFLIFSPFFSLYPLTYVCFTHVFLDYFFCLGMLAYLNYLLTLFISCLLTSYLCFYTLILILASLIYFFDYF